MGQTLALIGGQWGSEGKGVIAARLAGRFDAAVRVGGPNAGHSLYFEERLYKMRSVPCAWVEDSCELYLGAGAALKPELLREELNALPWARQITVDPLAVIIKEEYEHAEQDIRRRIGSTSEGVGLARAARMRRDGSAQLAKDYDWRDDRVIVSRVAPALWSLLDDGAMVMLEGAQGSALSLLHGSYPHVTSADTNAAQLAADVGLAPWDITHVQLVLRTFPIRVANPPDGTSGPMGEEIDWQELIDAGVVEQPEQTTVTRKQRRIARFSWEFVDQAYRLNRPCGWWLMFGDYLDPAVKGRSSIVSSPPVMSFVRELEARYKVPVLGVGTGPVKNPDGQVIDWEVARWERRCLHRQGW